MFMLDNIKTVDKRYKKTPSSCMCMIAENSRSLKPLTPYKLNTLYIAPNVHCLKKIKNII